MIRVLVGEKNYKGKKEREDRGREK